MLDDSWQSSDGGKNDGYRKDNRKSGLERYPPKFVIVDFGLLSVLKLKKLSFGKKITVVVGTGKDGNIARNRVVFNARHDLITKRTGGGRGGNSCGFGENRVDVFGGVGRDEAGEIWG